MSRHDAERPLVIIGLDAGDPGFIEQWAGQGHLPAIASIMKRGAWGRTGGAELVSEHGVWLSLFSGISRGRHGYYYFRQLKPGTYNLAPTTGMDIDAPPFWSVWEHRADRSAVIIDAPDQAIRPGLRGLQLANWDTHHNWDPLRYPTAAFPDTLLREIRRRYSAREITPEKAESTPTEDLEIFRAIAPRILKKGRLCRELFGRDRFDLYITVFAEPHAANHQFWRYCPEVASPQEPEPGELTHAIRSVYQDVDHQIGEMLAALPPKANVIILSSVGMEDDYPVTGLSEAFFRELSYQAAPAPGRVSWHPLDLARRVLPEPVRVGLSRHFPRERRERLLADQFRSGTDWDHTRAFALPSAYTTFVRVNLRGREPRGIVNPDREYEGLLDQIENDLRELIDPVTGQATVTRIHRSCELFGGGPPVVLPDLFVEWRPGRFLEQVCHPRLTLTQAKPDFYRRSDHSAEGFFAAAGPDIDRAGRLDNIDVLDVAPTLLQLLGEPIPARLKGRVLPLVNSVPAPH